MALGFKIADGYVEVHANYDKAELRRAAQQAAGDSDRAFNKERERSAKSGATRDSNRRIGRMSRAEFVKGFVVMQDELKKNPLFKIDDVKKDAANMGRIHATGFRRGWEEGVVREDSQIKQIGQRFARHIRTGFERETNKNLSQFRTMGQKVTNAMFGRDNAVKAGVNFFKAFIEAVSFGQADFSRPEITGKLTRWGARLGSILGVSLAGALVVQIGNAVTALLPLALGGALLAVPIADLIFRNISLEKGKLSFEKSAIGKALKGFIRGAQKLADQLGKVFSPAFQAILESGTRLFEAIEKPLTRAVKAITPGAVALWNGLLGAVVSFGKAMGPAMSGINAGLKQWGVELPKIGKALGQAFAQILKNPELVRSAVRGLSSLLQFLLKAAAGLVTFLTYALGAWNNLWRLADIGWKIFSKWIGLPGILSRIWNALKPLRVALLDAWEAFKKFATASTDQQALTRFKVLIDKIKAVWAALKPILAKALSEAWDRLKAYWNAHVKPWWDNTAKPWLTQKAKAVAKWAFKALADAAIAELKKLPGRVLTELGKVPGKVKTALGKAVDAAKAKAKELVDRVVTFLKTLPSKARSAVSSLWSRMASVFTNAVSQAKSAGTKLVNGFITIVKTIVSKARSAVSGVKSAITGAFSSAGTWLIQAGRNIIHGLVSGLGQMTGLSGVLSKITAFVKSHKGPPAKDKVLLFDNGRLIMQGLMKGIESQRPALRSQLGGLTAQVPAMAGGRSGSGEAKSYSSTFSPNVVVHISEGLNPMNAAARRALIKDIFLELEQYKKDYVR